MISSAGAAGKCGECKNGTLLPVIVNTVAQGSMGGQSSIIYKCTNCGAIFKY